MAKSGKTVQQIAQSVDLNSIAVFVKIVEAGSFSSAARLLKMPKTTVSAKFAALEESLGVSLIQRTTRKLHITPVGQRYFAHCVAAMRQIEDGTADLSASKDTPQGSLTITAPPDIAQTLLPGMIRAYLARYPAVNVNLVVENRVVDVVGEGIDLAIRTGPPRDSSLIGRRFFNLTANVWASPSCLEQIGTPRAPRDLSSIPFVAFGAMKTIEMVKGKAAASFEINERVRADDFQTIRGLISEGVGIGWLPDFLSEEGRKSGLLVPVLPGWKARDAGTVHFLYGGRKHSSATVRAFIEVALSEVSKLSLTADPDDLLSVR